MEAQTMERIPSEIPFDYKTIKVTESRIDKGLLAIPVSLLDFFPQNKAQIRVAVGPKGVLEPKNFTPYSSRSRECRIGGMREFYTTFSVRSGDEVVVQRIGQDEYRVLTEKQFEELVIGAEKKLDSSTSEEDAEASLKEISAVTAADLKATALSEYYRLSRRAMDRRRYRQVNSTKVREETPPVLRHLLGEIYGGRCQVSDFGFLMKNGKPYFETHHIRPAWGHHVKNVLVVCPNVHAQFTHAHVDEFFDEDGWLRRVKFNGEEFMVKHAIDMIPGMFTKEIHFEA